MITSHPEQGTGAFLYGYEENAFGRQPIYVFVLVCVLSVASKIFYVFSLVKKMKCQVLPIWFLIDVLQKVVLLFQQVAIHHSFCFSFFRS